MGEDEDRTRLSEGARQSSVRPTATSSGREADVFDLGGIPDVEGSETCIVLGVWSMMLCVGKAVTGFSGVVGMQRLSVVV